MERPICSGLPSLTLLSVIAPPNSASLLARPSGWRSREQKTGSKAQTGHGLPKTTMTG